MKIAEMEAHHDQWADLDRTIKTMADQREFPEVFSACEASFRHIVPAIKYRTRKGIEPETPTLRAFDTVCKYGPPLFEHGVLQSLLEFVESTRFLARHEKGYLDQITTALQAEETARVVWNHLEGQPGALERQIRARAHAARETVADIIGVWERLGVVIRKPDMRGYRLHFRTRLGADAQGMCPACGVRGRGRVELFFKRTTCRNCGADVYYHIDYPND